ncbi:MAG: hypothetical protein CM15mP102_13600 [Flavobacteriales bacterium]|nr:MAG: hypothetical protein CM15mP102_13600 [Flavobacteriales bacterium]
MKSRAILILKISINVICDVDNPLMEGKGAAFVYLTKGANSLNKKKI